MQPENIISYAFDQVDLFILGGRQEVGTFKRIDRRFDLLAKESHLLQMRGLKQVNGMLLVVEVGRIFYRCVD